MSVLLEYWLPDSPPDGSRVEYIALGGNGKTAPHSYYAFDLQIAGDASGGLAEIYCRMDDRYTGLPTYGMGLISGQVAAAPMTMNFAATFVDRVEYGENVEVVQPGTTFYTNQFVVEPTPFICQGRPREQLLMTPPWFRLIADNPGVGNDMRLVGRVYNFDINVRTLTPLPYILASLPR